MIMNGLFYFWIYIVMWGKKLCQNILCFTVQSSLQWLVFSLLLIFQSISNEKLTKELTPLDCSDWEVWQLEIPSEKNICSSGLNYEVLGAFSTSESTTDWLHRKKYFIWLERHGIKNTSSRTLHLQQLQLQSTKRNSKEILKRPKKKGNIHTQKTFFTRKKTFEKWQSRFWYCIYPHCP